MKRSIRKSFRGFGRIGAEDLADDTTLLSITES